MIIIIISFIDNLALFYLSLDGTLFPDDQGQLVGHQFSPEFHAANSRLQIRSLEGYTEPPRLIWSRLGNSCTEIFFDYR